MLSAYPQIPVQPAALWGILLADINDLPQINYDKCIGCGLCIASCPGLAIFVLDMTYSKDKALIKLPYEVLPLPRPGQLVTALNREGREVAQTEVIKVQKTKQKTYIISIIVPKELALVVRNIKVKESLNG